MSEPIRQVSEIIADGQAPSTGGLDSEPPKAEISFILGRLLLRVTQNAGVCLQGFPNGKQA